MPSLATTNVPTSRSGVPLPMTERQREDVFNCVRQSGLEVHESDDFTLQLDIDSKPDLKVAKEMLKMLKQWVPIENVSQTRSKSSKWHLWVRLTKPHTPMIRVLMQALCGSDRKREMLNFAAIYQQRNGNPVFFERPNARRRTVRL